jgi:hypothetical protein
MPINNISDLPTGTTQTIDGVEQQVFSLTERKDIADFNKRCLEDTSDTLTISLSITDDSVSPAVTHSHSWTGTGGASAYWADWRSNHSSLDGSNGNGAENVMHERWQDFVNENYQQDGTALTKAEMITKLTNEIAQCDTMIAAESESSEPSE